MVSKRAVVRGVEEAMQRAKELYGGLTEAQFGHVRLTLLKFFQDKQVGCRV